MSVSGRPDPDVPSEAAVHTRIVPGVVDVVVLRERATFNPSNPHDSRWEVLTLQRGAHTRCTGAWEIVHGRIERGERPEQAAMREVAEETGMTPVRLYSITVNSFYLHQTGTVYLALVFAAIVPADVATAVGEEHSTAEWRSFAAASEILAWPREREALAHVQQLLRNGDAGAVEDVLRIV